MGDRKDLNFWEKPPFNNARGIYGPNWITPPMLFQGVTMWGFPLRANVHAVQRLVDGLLNSSFAPERGGWFRAFMPYIYLMILDYGRMGALASNLGWISQQEIAFSIPLEWYRPEGGRYVFHDWAWVSPIIFVDQEVSMSTGREVYGWPKSIAWMSQPDVSKWIKDPLDKHKLLSLSTLVVDKAYAGERFRRRVFLELEHGVAGSNVQFDPRSLLLPWVGIPNAIQNFQSLLGESFTLLKRQFFDPSSPGYDPLFYAGVQSRLGEMIGSIPPNISFNTVNLKQFRAASDPELACYKALVNARIRVKQINRMGMLGDTRIFMGDLSGGYSINLHRFPSLSLAETFGLEGTKTEIDARTVWTVQPVLPFWLDVDLVYDRPQTIAWNAGSVPSGLTSVDPTLSLGTRGYREQMRIRTTDGTVAQQMTGPFDFPNVTLRVLPLLAKAQQLNKLCNEYLNQPLDRTGLSFEPWGNYVYLIISSYEGMSSRTNNVGIWAERDVRYCMPVKRFALVNGKKVFRGLALIPIFCYADNVIAANTGAEVNGLPVSWAVITSPESRWLGEAGPGEANLEPLLELRTRVLPALSQNQPAEERTLMEVVGYGDIVAGNDVTAQRFIIAGWGNDLKRESHQMQEAIRRDSTVSDDALCLALELLANERPLKYINFKQFRDAEEPERACYQSLIELSTRSDKIYDMREIDAPLHVRIHAYPTHPIVETLGLIPKTIDSKGTNVVFNLEPVRPFWMKLSLSTDLGRLLCWRSSTRGWVMMEASEEGYFHRPPDSTKPAAFDLKRLEIRQRLNAQVRQWKYDTGVEHLLSSERALKAVEQVTPQMIIQMVLSREWEYWGNSRAYQARQRIDPLIADPDQPDRKGLVELLEETKDKTPVPEVQQQVNDLIGMLKRNQKLSPEDIVTLRNVFIKCWQKPDWTVSGISMREFRLPLKKEEKKDFWQWDERWYVGPDQKKQDPQ
jgi:hypothetical protein